MGALGRRRRLPSGDSILIIPLTGITLAILELQDAPGSPGRSFGPENHILRKSRSSLGLFLGGIAVAEFSQKF